MDRDENDREEDDISQSQTHTFTKISIGSQTDLEILLLYVQNLQQAFKPPPIPSAPPTSTKNGLNEDENDEEDVDEAKNEDVDAKDEEGDEGEEEEREIISPSSLSVPQKVQFFEDFSKDKEYCSFAQAHSLNFSIYS